MNFLYPTFLIALLAIAIPIIIHLFNFRRYKTVLFSDIQFLKNIKKETKKKLQLKHLLILIARILAVASLVFAFAQPYIPVANNVQSASQEIVAVYLDNSFSMDAIGVDGNLFEVAKNKIPKITEAFRPETKYFFLSNDFSQKYQQFVNKDQLADFLNDLNTGPVVRNLSEVISRQNDFVKSLVNEESSITSIIISDFQKSSSNFEDIVTSNNVSTMLLPLASQKANNIFIDSCWFENPGRKYNQAENLFVRIVNNSGEGYINNPIKLFINDSLKAISGFDIEPNSSQTITLSYTNTQKGIISGRIEINDYPITYDNIFYFSYEVAEQLRILSISNKAINKFVDALFSNDEMFEVTNNSSDKINFSLLPLNNLVIISGIAELSSGLIQEIENYISNGGSVLFFPAKEGDINTYNTFLSKLETNLIIGIDTSKTKINKVNYNHSVYANAFRKIKDNIELPTVYRHYVFEHRTNSGDEEILTTINNHSFLHKAKYSKGSIYVVAVPLDDVSSDFSKHPIFLPAVYNMAFNSRADDKLYCTIGKDRYINKSIVDNNLSLIFHVVNTTGEFDYIPDKQTTRNEIRLFVDDAIDKAGNYFIKANERNIAGVSYNYNRKESNLDYYTNNEIENLILKNDLLKFEIIAGGDDSFSTSLKEMKQGKQLWKLFILFVLLFIIIEVAIIKLMK